MQKARKRKSGGFTVIEAIAAMTVLAIAATAVAAGLITASNSVGNSVKKSVANDIAQAELENARALPYEKLGTVGGFPTGNIPGAPKTLARSGVRSSLRPAPWRRRSGCTPCAG